MHLKTVIIGSLLGSAAAFSFPGRKASHNPAKINDAQVNQAIEDQWTACTRTLDANRKMAERRDADMLSLILEQDYGIHMPVKDSVHFEYADLQKERDEARHAMKHAKDVPLDDELQRLAQDNPDAAGLLRCKAKLHQYHGLYGEGNPRNSEALQRNREALKRGLEVGLALKGKRNTQAEPANES